MAVNEEVVLEVDEKRLREKSTDETEKKRQRLSIHEGTSDVTRLSKSRSTDSGRLSSQPEKVADNSNCPTDLFPIFNFKGNVKLAAGLDFGKSNLGIKDKAKK